MRQTTVGTGRPKRACSGVRHAHTRTAVRRHQRQQCRMEFSARGPALLQWQRPIVRLLPPVFFKFEAHTKLDVMHKSRNDDSMHSHTYVGTHARMYACTHRRVGTYTHM